MSTLPFTKTVTSGEHSKRSPRRVAGTDWEGKTVNIDRYRQVSLRLFGQSVSSQNGSESCFDRREETQMLRNRQRVLRYYLREMRRDFVSLWSLCRRRFLRRSWQEPVSTETTRRFLPRVFPGLAKFPDPDLSVGRRRIQCLGGELAESGNRRSCTPRISFLEKVQLTHCSRTQRPRDSDALVSGFFFSTPLQPDPPQPRQLMAEAPPPAEPSPLFSPRGEAKCVRGASVRGARRLTRAGVLDSTLSTASKRNEVLAGLSRASVGRW